MFLEKSELVQLTGYVHMSKQKTVLDQMGVAHKLRESDNTLLVLKDDVVGMMRGRQKEPAGHLVPAGDPEVIENEALPGFAVE